MYIAIHRARSSSVPGVSGLKGLVWGVEFIPKGSALPLELRVLLLSFRRRVIVGERGCIVETVGSEIASVVIEGG